MPDGREAAVSADTDFQHCAYPVGSTVRTRTDGMDLLLLFPPLTEATLFPYLSLSYLAGDVRRFGYSAHQVDLSICTIC
ncbi:hypothetical protein [Streptomyces sp. NPDC058308]|uniref:hypothetical protein n=1 Tax=Streptomyces sp. NPDC058308 TaxID=3346440 RepID=UPI0036F0A6B3